MALPEGTRGSKGCQRREAGNKKPLLPRIPDHVTLNLIAPKLSWGDCHRLSSVSRAWRHAIQSRQVHDARIRLQSTETLILLAYNSSMFPKAIVVYSMRDNRCYKLPPFPYRDGRMPPPFEITPTFRCVAVDGKVYVLGGEFVPDEVSGNSGVYVLDLAAGGRQWKQCKSMIEPRALFGCGVLDGKIYVLGGLSNTGIVCGSEVYDPKEDTWSPIKAMRFLRFRHQVATVGTELVVHGGNIVEPTDPGWKMWIRAHGGFAHFRQPYDFTDFSEFLSRIVAEHVRTTFPLLYRIAIKEVSELLSRIIAEYVLSTESPLFHRIAKEANSLEVYDTIKDEWSVVEGPEEVYVSSMAKEKLPFMAKGKYHVMNFKDVHVHDTETNSWTHVHSNPMLGATLRLLDCKLRDVLSRVTVAVDDKLLTILEGVDKNGERNQACPLQGTGTGSDNEKVIWERTPFAIFFEEEEINFTNYSIIPVQF